MKKTFTMKYKILVSTAFFMFSIMNLAISQEVSEDLISAIKKGEASKLEEMVKQEDLNRCFDFKNSSYNFLAISIRMESPKALEFFVEKGANLESICTGKTPLMYCAKYGYLDLAKYLLEKGANLNTVNSGKTALDYAVKYEQKEVETLLKDFASEKK